MTDDSVSMFVASMSEAQWELFETVGITEDLIRQTIEGFRLTPPVRRTERPSRTAMHAAYRAKTRRRNRR